MKLKTSTLIALSAAAFAVLPLSSSAREYQWQVVKDGLDSPTGIDAVWNEVVAFTQLPTPGTNGGDNTVSLLNLSSGNVTNLSVGEPEPLNIAVGNDGDIYWTCRTANVILKYNPDYGKMVFLGAEELMKPTGIDVASNGDVVFTEVPNPGVMGGNLVSVSNGTTTTTISDFEPDPTDIIIADNGYSYWTCKTAGVIVSRSPAGVVEVMLTGLNSPTGIALNGDGSRLFFTEVPTPGLSGANGGTNSVMEYDLHTNELSLVAAGFPYPADITVAPNGLVYWTCQTAGVIVRGWVKK